MKTNRLDHTGHNHPNTSAARALCRRMITALDTAWQERYAANGATPYVHDVYDHFEQTSKRIALAFTCGDQQWADALDDCWVDSQEDVRWYLNYFGSRDSMVYNMNRWVDDTDRVAIETRLGLYADDLDD